MLRYMGIAGVAAAAGCISDSEEADDTGATDDDAPAPSDDDGDDAEPGERRIGEAYVSGSPSDGETLVPFQITDTTSGGFLNLVLDGAYTLTPEDDFNPFPLWLDIQTDDGQEYWCELRDNLYWSDPYGQMTAEDWVYYIHEIHQGEDNWAGSIDVSDWHDADGNPLDVEKTGDLTFEIRLDSVDPAYPQQPVMWNKQILPQGLIEPYVEDQDLEGLQQSEEVNELTYTGNLGPYTFERWDRESEFAVTRNDEYYMREVDDVPEEWNDAPYYDEYTINVISEESSRLGALQTGEVHSTDVPDTRVESFEDAEDTYVNNAPTPFCRVMPYNMRRNGWDGLKNVEVRQALGHAVNKEVILDQIQRGLGIPAYTFQPEWSEWYVDDEVERFGVGDTYDHDRARDMLESALGPDYGYDAGELLDPDGHQVQLDMVVRSGDEVYETTAEYIQQEYAEIGIDLQYHFSEWSTMIERYMHNEWVGDGDPPWQVSPDNMGPRDQTESAEDWDLMYGINFNAYPLTPTASSVFWHEHGAVNFYGYIPEEGEDMEAMWNEAAREPDADRRRELLGEIYGILSRDQPVSFLNFSDDTTGYRTKVQGPDEVFQHSWDSNTWYFSE